MHYTINPGLPEKSLTLSGSQDISEQGLQLPIQQKQQATKPAACVANRAGKATWTKYAECHD